MYLEMMIFQFFSFKIFFLIELFSYRNNVDDTFHIALKFFRLSIVPIYLHFCISFFAPPVNKLHPHT